MTCEICGYASGKSKAKKLYEDDEILAIFHPSPAAFGHAIVMPKEHYTILPQVPDPVIQKMFLISQQIAGIIFESVGAEGTNLMINEGVPAGQKHAHVMVHIIPRKQEDGLSFEWQQKQIPEDSMNKIHELLKIPEEAVAEQPQEKKQEPIVKKEEKKETGKEHLVRHWTRRIPR